MQQKFLFPLCLLAQKSVKQLNQLQRVSFLAIMPIVLLFSAFAMSQSGYTTVTTAQKDQPVAVIRDYTASSHCTMNFAHGPSLNTLRNAPKQTIACPAGTILEQTVVPLTEAQAQHEHYVVLPPRNSSTQVILSFETQLQQLETSVQQKYHFVASQVVQPLNVTQCGQTTDWYVNWSAPNTTFHSIIEVYRDQSCNMWLAGSLISANPIGFFYYWRLDAYAGWSQNRNCQQIGNTYDTAYPWVEEASGYYYEQWVGTGSNCTWLDTCYYVNIGPLS